MTTAVVILNWNGRACLEAYLPSVTASLQGCDGVSVVVADNGSEDDSAAYVKENFPQVQWIQLRRNYGFAEGYNRALKSLDSDCFLLLNSDVKVENGWFEPLQEWMELHPDCGICGPKLHMTGEKSKFFEYSGAAGGYLDCYGYPFCRGRVMGRVEEDEGQYDIPAEVFWVSGAALMVRREVFVGARGFCNDFFAHMEEIDLCWRVRADGWKVHIVPRSVVYHEGGATLPASSPFKSRLNFRNNLLMLERNLPFTLALHCFYNFLAVGVDEDTCQDLFAQCGNLYREIESADRKSLLEGAAVISMKLTRIRLNFRQFLDFLSALVYLFSFRPKHFKAVMQAHREYRRMRRPVGKRELIAELKNVVERRPEIARVLLRESPCPGCLGERSFGIAGIWNKWTVWRSLTEKGAIFAHLRDTSL